MPELDVQECTGLSYASYGPVPENEPAPATASKQYYLHLKRGEARESDENANQLFLLVLPLQSQLINLRILYVPQVRHCHRRL